MIFTGIDVIGDYLTEINVTSPTGLQEIARFDALAGQWWDPDGPMRPLHRMNPVRIEWIDQRLERGRRLLDVGCGAGLAAEALARRGHTVLGIDAASSTRASPVHFARDDAGVRASAHRPGQRSQLGFGIARGKHRGRP